MARRRLIVQQAAVGDRDHPRAAVDRKPPTRTVGEAVGLRIPTVRIRPAHCPHSCPVRRILCYRIRRQTQIRRGIVGCCNCDRSSFCRGAKGTSCRDAAGRDLHIVDIKPVIATGPCDDELNARIRRRIG